MAENNSTDIAPASPGATSGRLLVDLAALLRSSPGLVGTYTLSGSAPVLEAVAQAGFDYVIVDCEHSGTSPYGSEVETLLRAIEVAGPAALVRVLDNDHGQIGRVLDAGATGVIVPHVRTAADMERAIRSALRPPVGNRGSAPMVRSAGYGTRSWTQVVNDPQPVVGPLVEDPEAVENIEGILDVTGVGALWFGAFDLAVALGLPNAGERDQVIDAHRDRVYRAAAERGIPVLDHAWDAPEAARLLGLGAAGVSVSTDLTTIARGMVAVAADVRKLSAGNGHSA